MILIFSKKTDYSTGCVIQWLNFLGERVIRMNGDDNLFKLEEISETGIFFRHSITGELINLDDTTACWWRRPGLSINNFNHPAKNSTLSIGDINLTPFLRGNKGLLDKESNDLIDYIYQRVHSKSPINIGRPMFNLNKLVTLELAQKHGLSVPSYTIVTNGWQVQKSKDIYENLVSKAISNGIYGDIDNKRFYTYTELLDDSFVTHSSQSNYYPSLVMQLIEKEIEIRSFYLNGKFFSMAIFSQSNEQTKVDFRKYSASKPNKTEPFILPREIELKLEKVFNEINLNSGSIDFIIDKSGNYIFLEINPVGQYNMVSNPCNYNLDKIIATFLINGRC
jgi:ATP-GRASP peptide maturase of grasp-with-spasm system